MRWVFGDRNVQCALQPLEGLHWGTDGEIEKPHVLCLLRGTMEMVVELISLGNRQYDDNELLL